MPASPRTAVLARHVERQKCGALLEIAGDKERPSFSGLCGYETRHPLHDLFPILGKRDTLSPPFREADRHAFNGVGAGFCDADEDEWPCAAYRLAEAAQQAAPLDVETLWEQLLPFIRVKDQAKARDAIARLLLRTDAIRHATAAALAVQAAGIDPYAALAQQPTEEEK